MTLDAYQVLGRERHEYVNLLEEYRKLLALVGQIKAGQVDPQTVEILPGDAWRINVTLDASNLTADDLLKAIPPCPAPPDS